VDRARATLQPLALAMVALLSATFPAYAQDGPALPVHASTYSINIVWVLIAGFLIMLMQLGFALLETGFRANRSRWVTWRDEHSGSRLSPSRVAAARGVPVPSSL
jgi:hypothetical protein